MQKYLPFLLALVWITSCRKGDLKSNQAPNTQISVTEINLTGDERLNSEVSLSWFGTDLDGFVQGFEISLDQQNWNYTTSTDSTFIFAIEPGQDTTDIDFYVRAIDNEGQTDQTPAFLRIPLKNTPPAANIDDTRGPKDTAFCAATFYWSASDPDGNETIEQVFIKFNEGSWVEISQTQNLISFLVDTGVSNGSATAEIYYGTRLSPESFTIDGLMVNGNNNLFVKSVDIAGVESPVDTSSSFYLTNKTPGVNTLWINGHVNTIAQEYRSLLDANNINYDFLDYGSNMGANQPVYWDPTFRLILNLYSKAFINAPSSLFPNTVTGQNASLLNYIGSSIQIFHDNGGKSLTTCSLDPTEDLTNMSGPFPLEGIVESNGFVRISRDSLVFSVSTNPLFPDIQPSFTLPGIVPIIKAADSEDFYRAQLSPFNGWEGDNLVASVRKNSNNKITQAFFSVELHDYDANISDLESLIGEILNNEF